MKVSEAAAEAEVEGQHGAGALDARLGHETPTGPRTVADGEFDSRRPSAVQMPCGRPALLAGSRTDTSAAPSGSRVIFQA